MTKRSKIGAAQCVGEPPYRHMEKAREMIGQWRGRHIDRLKRRRELEKKTDGEKRQPALRTRRTQRSQVHLRVLGGLGDLPPELQVKRVPTGVTPNAALPAIYTKARGCARETNWRSEDRQNLVARDR